jgi:hypothetical protein
MNTFKHFARNILGVVTLCSCLAHQSIAQNSFAQNSIGLSIYTMAHGGWNRTLSPLTKAEFQFSPLPAFGAEGTYSLNAKDEGRVVFAVGYQPYATRSVSGDPFSGRAIDDFQINTLFHYLVVAAGMRFNRVAGIPSIGFVLRGGLPLLQTYQSTVDVFEVNGDAQVSTGVLQSFAVPPNRAEPTVEALLEAVPGEWSFIEGQTLSLVVQAGMVINGLVRFIPPRVIPPSYNIIGQDPLAGLRTFNVQPISVNIGLRYSWQRIATL